MGNKNCFLSGFSCRIIRHLLRGFSLSHRVSALGNSNQLDAMLSCSDSILPSLPYIEKTAQLSSVQHAGIVEIEGAPLGACRRQEQVVRFQLST